MRWSKPIVTGLSVAVLASGLLVAAPLPADAAPPGGTQPVVVVLRDQLTGVPTTRAHVAGRRAEARSAQQAVLSALRGAAPGHVRSFSLGDAFAATVTPAQRASLAANPDVAAVLPDAVVHLAPPAAAQTRSAAQARSAARTKRRPATGGSVPADVCPSDPGRPLAEPEALTSVRAANTGNRPNAQELATGAGVTVGFIADRVDPGNADFVRPDGSHAITATADFSGAPVTEATDGREAFGDASSIAAQGTVTHDLSTYVSPAHALPRGCTIRIRGMAPDADVVTIDAFEDNATTISSLLQAIDYAVDTAHVDVLNESFGQSAFPDAGSRDALELFNDQAVSAGVTVTVASGDAGLTGTVDTPGADPDVITVGASTDFRGATQVGDDGASPTGPGWVDDNVSALSSGGFTQGGGTIDLTAPGERNWAACSEDPRFAGCLDLNGEPTSFFLFGGTSEAAPLTAGAAALVIQAYRRTHAGRSPGPALVKRLLTGTAKDMGVAGEDQGAGLLDARAAVEAATTFPGASTPPPPAFPPSADPSASHLVLSADRLSHDGPPGSSRTDMITVTDAGTAPLTVTGGLRQYRDRGPATVLSVPLDPATDPLLTAADGTGRAYRKTSFTVAPGTDLLNVRAAWPGPSATDEFFGDLGSVVFVSLFDPRGRLVADSLPEGDGLSANYANLLVRQPSTGTWTALVSTDHDTGFTGTVRMSATQERAVPVGSVSPASFTLQPGGHTSVKVTSTFPAAGGDSSATLSFRTPSGDAVAVPDVLRTLVPITAGSGSFAGSVTGGNGRGGDPAQSFTYSFDVPRGAPGLTVATTLARDKGDLLAGALIDPNGETPSVGSNYPAEQEPDPSVTDPSMSLSVANPLPGRWRFVLAAQNPVSGDRLTMPFTGTIALRAGVAVRTSGLPTTARTTLAAHTATTASVTVTNPGPATLYVQTDARTATRRNIPLRPRTVFPGESVDPVITLPMGTFGALSYLVPPQTTAVTVTGTSTVPSTVDVASVGMTGAWGGVNGFGDLKAAQAGGTTSTAVVKEAHGYVGQGDWTVSATEVGPYGPGGTPSGRADVDLTAATLGFDPTVTSATGDPYVLSTDPTADPGHPVAVAPGATATIDLTLTPDAAPGTTVTGILNIVTPGDATVGGRIVFSPAQTSGDVLATVPYTYTVAAAAS